MFKKELPVIILGLSIVVAVLVLSWAVFIKPMPAVPIQTPVVSDNEIITDDIEDDNMNDNNVSDDDISDWNVYRNEEYGFEMKYPDILFLSKQEHNALILRSFSTTNIEASSVSDMTLSIENIKTSSYEDAQNYIKDLPIYLEGVGPYKNNIGGTLVYINMIKLYGGGEGVYRNYYFPKFILTFAYANNDAENEFKVLEEKILFTFKFIEK